MSAELRDALETHESRVVCLNQQVNCLSLKLTEAEKCEKQLGKELSDAVVALQAAELEVQERERELLSNCEGLQRQLDMANAKVLEVVRESEDVREERLSLISEYEGRECKVQKELAQLKSELSSTLETVTDLTGRLESAQREREDMSREAAVNLERAEAGRDDAMAEVEILQARISELTREAINACQSPDPPHSGETEL